MLGFGTVIDTGFCVLLSKVNIIFIVICLIVNGLFFSGGWGLRKTNAHISQGLERRIWSWRPILDCLQFLGLSPHLRQFGEHGSYGKDIKHGDDIQFSRWGFPWFSKVFQLSTRWLKIQVRTSEEERQAYICLFFCKYSVRRAPLLILSRRKLLEFLHSGNKIFCFRATYCLVQEARTSTYIW